MSAGSIRLVCGIVYGIFQHTMINIQCINLELFEDMLYNVCDISFYPANQSLSDL